VPEDVVRGDPELRQTLEMIEQGFFTPHNPDDATEVADRLRSDGEPFLVLRDFRSYAAAQAAVDALYQDPDQWSRHAVVNCLNMGMFSSDRTIREYAEHIWNIRPVI
jgi:glycogen phosphorylase